MSFGIGIGGLGATAAVQGGARRTGPGGFRVMPEAEAGACAAGVASVSLSLLLGLQEAEQGQVEDREARRHGEAMLEALGAMQRALLGGAAAGTLERLADLVQRMPPAADPRLVAVQRALLVRAAVELARSRAAASL